MTGFFISFSLLIYCFASFAGPVRVGSKAFTEGYLLGELGAQKIEASGENVVTRKFGLGSTGVVLQALLTKEIDLYPEYTGTIAESVFHDLSIRKYGDLQEKLQAKGLVMSEELGFQNTYALAVTRDIAAKYKLSSISDLKGHEQQIRAAFSPEFLNRKDGLRSLEKFYGLHFGQNIQSIDHMLSFFSVSQGKADLVAVYSTDDQIDVLNLVVLKDDLQIFPPYQAVFLARQSFVEENPQAWAAINSLANTVGESVMRKLNGQVERGHQPAAEVISQYLGQTPVTDSAPVWNEVKRRTYEHLYLIAVTLVISVLIGIPLGLASARSRRMGQLILLGSSLIQTVPSLALLCLLIPFFGIGLVPALIALCLYSLLPVVQNTLLGLQSIPDQTIETAKALGLSKPRILFAIELPLASRSIVAGVRTAAIISIGTATLAALIGAGGYGAPIISGLSTNNTEMILMGAIPCTLMALVTFGLFEILNFILIPKGLRLK